MDPWLGICETHIPSNMLVGVADDNPVDIP